MQAWSPYSRVGCKEVLIPKIDVGADKTAMFISLVIKEPFKVRIRENPVLQLVNTEWAVADAASSKETDTVLLVVLILLALTTLTDFAVDKLVVEVIVWHLASEINAMSTITAAMIDKLVEELVVL